MGKKSRHRKQAAKRKRLKAMRGFYWNPKTTQDELIEGIDKRMEAEDNPGALKYLAELKEHLERSNKVGIVEWVAITAVIAYVGMLILIFIFGD